MFLSMYAGSPIAINDIQTANLDSLYTYFYKFFCNSCEGVIPLTLKSHPSLMPLNFPIEKTRVFWSNIVPPFPIIDLSSNITAFGNANENPINQPSFQML